MTWTTFDSNGKQQIAGSVADMPVGTIVDFAADNPPNGWLKCDGSTVSRTGFSDLFAVISTNYGSGDGSTTFTLPDITGAVIFATPLDKRIKVLTPPQYVSALPAAPIDGQEVYYVASTASGVVWHLRYNAASSSSYKWEFVGGAPMFSQDAPVSSRSASATTSTWLGTTSDPAVTVPLAGDYEVIHSAKLSVSSGAATLGVGVKVGSTEAALTHVLTSTNYESVGTAAQTPTGHGVITGVAASTALTQRYIEIGGSVTLYRDVARMRVIPVRVG